MNAFIAGIWCCICGVIVIICGLGIAILSEEDVHKLNAVLYIIGCIATVMIYILWQISL